MSDTRIIFFGSTTDSEIVAEKLSGYTIVAVVTQPPKPFGRAQIITPTPVEIWAKKHSIPVLTFPSNSEKPSAFNNEDVVADTLAPFKADLLVSASFGQKIPERTIREARWRGVNVHPSILPRWRGADPVPWAILTGDHQIGVTIVTINNLFDEGKILAQHKIPLKGDETSDPLRTALFTSGADLLISILPDYIAGTIRGTAQDPKKASYARKFTREDGFELWESLMDTKETERIDRKFRALHPWPGLWVLFQNKRLKILGYHHGPTLVQLEGKKPVSWSQFKSAYL
jgi:methionyl-tRNA formyltransferase